MSYDEGAALPMNYLTAQFALAERGDLAAGRDRPCPRGRGRRRHRDDPGGQGAGRPRHRGRHHRGEGRDRPAAGADEVVLLEGFKDAVAELTGGKGVDIVVDVVGGDAFTDSLRCLGTQCRLLVVGFAAGQGIPEVKVNRLLLNNVDVRGVGWGAYAMVRRSTWAAVGGAHPADRGRVVKPPIGATYDLDQIGQALSPTWRSGAPSASR